MENGYREWGCNYPLDAGLAHAKGEYLDREGRRMKWDGVRISYKRPFSQRRF